MQKGQTHGKWHGPWCTYFQALLDERGLNPSDFAALSGEPQHNVWRYLNGIIRPPVKKLPAWSRKLDLDDAEAEKFRRLAVIAHASPELRAEVDELRHNLAAQRTQNKAIIQLLREHGVDTSALGEIR